MSPQRKRKPRVLPPPVREELDHPDHYLSRELSQLEFVRRVLAQARDPAVPLLERLRFLAISCSILDEFYEVRVAGLKQQVLHSLPNLDPDPLTSRELLERIDLAARAIVSEQYRVLSEELRPALMEAGIRLLQRHQWSEAQAAWVQEHFRSEVLPVLTPVGLDPAHPFPQILNKSLNFIVSLHGTDAYGRDSSLAIVQAPRILPRVLVFPAAISGARTDLLLLSSLIRAQVSDLFPGMEIKGCWQFRVTRNSDLWVDEEEVDDLLHALKGELPRRKYSEAVRLEVESTCPPDIRDFLLREFDLGPQDLVLADGPVNLHRLEAIHSLLHRPDLKFPPFSPRIPEPLATAPDLFEEIRRGDILLHHPFQSFVPVLEMVRQASRDPEVLAIKQTLYRTGADSPLAEALLAAAMAGKEVTAVIELRARFDEAANIELATRLQEAGARVVYGVVGLKTHAKLLMIVRREAGSLRRYVHLGTGNYHTGTARAYTDFGLITADPDIGQDAHEIFQQLTGLGSTAPLRRLIQSPFHLRDRIIALIDAETEAARSGRPARIVAKMNALLDPAVIRALYQASRAGVPIDLVVRGLCTLRPGLPGLSENIRVRSIVGRFLEHTRIFHFLSGGENCVLLSSADWMPRNLLRRVEIAFPVLAPELKTRVLAEGLDPYLRDDSQAWLMRPDGSYERAKAQGPKPFSAQAHLLQLLAAR
jgi:polyphosphate kinase